MHPPIWYADYKRTTDDINFNLLHFIRDYIFQHRLRHIIYLRIAQNTKNLILRKVCDYKLYRMSRKYGIEIKSKTKIGSGFILLHPYNITITPYAKIGDNVTILKGATIGLSKGKYRGAPTIGNRVYIGLNSTILGGITIGNDVMIAPNTFVNIPVPDNSIVIGNPCKIISKENPTKKYI